MVPVGDDPTLGARMMKNIARWPGVAVWLAADDRPADDGDREAGGPFASAFLRALEPAGRRNNLLGCLDVLGDDRTLSAQGFRTLGGLPPGATLWPEDRRNPRITDPDLVLQRGHAAAVRAIAFNADGSLMASGAEDSTIRLWRTRDRTLLRVLPYHANGVSCLAISPDGRLLASGDGMGGVRVWDLVKDEPMALLDPSPHDGNIAAVGFLPDGRSLVSADTDARWALWDLSGPSARLVRLANESTRAGRRPAFARRPGPVAAAMALTASGGDDRVGLFRPDQKETMAIEAGPGGTIERLALSADGRRLAVATEGGLVEVRDLDRGPVRPPQPFAAPITALELAAGRLVIRSAEGLHILAVDGEGEGERHDIEVEEEIEQLVVSPNGRRIAAVTGGRGEVRAWDLDAATGVPRPLPLAESAEGGALTLAFRPDGAALAAGDTDGGIRVWELPEGSRQPAIRPYRGQVVHVAASPDEVHLLQVTRDGVAKVWDLAGGGPPATLDGRFRPSGAFLPGGEGLVLLDEAGDVVVRGLDGGRRGGDRFEPPPVPGRDAAEGDFRAVAVSPDGRLVAAGGAEEPLVCVWDIKGGRARHELRKPHVERILAVQFSADGRHLLTASEGEAGVVAVWDLRARMDAPQRVIPPRDRLPLTAAAMNPADPARIAVARRDGRASVVELWGPGVGDLLAARAGRGRDRRPHLLGERGAPRRGGLGEAPVPLVDGPSARDADDPGPAPARREDQHRRGLAGRTLFVTGSDDTTMRFWQVDGASGEGRALGTLVASQGSPDWVAYTPDGLFDGSPDGVERVTRRVGGDVARLDQCYDLGHLSRLTDYLRRAESPRAPGPSSASRPRNWPSTWPPRPRGGRSSSSSGSGPASSARSGCTTTAPSSGATWTGTSATAGGACASGPRSPAGRTASSPWEGEEARSTAAPTSWRSPTTTRPSRATSMCWPWASASTGSRSSGSSSPPRTRRRSPHSSASGGSTATRAPTGRTCCWTTTSPPAASTRPSAGSGPAWRVAPRIRSSSSWPGTAASAAIDSASCSRAGRPPSLPRSSLTARSCATWPISTP